jgi:hypothetical protein
MLRIASSLLAVLLCVGSLPAPSAQGVTLSFRVERVEPTAPGSESPRTLLDLLRQRLDGEVSLAQGSPDTLTVAVPLSSLPEETLASALSADGTRLPLFDEGDDFDECGGLVLVDEEVIRYRGLEGSDLVGLERGVLGTRAMGHAARTRVRWLDGPGLLRRIESVGRLRLSIGASIDDFRAAGTDEAGERKKLEDWLASGRDHASFNRRTFEEGGPPPGIAWFPMRGSQGHSTALDVTEPDAWTFDTRHIARLDTSVDALGYPAVAFELRDDRREAFADFTEAHVNQALAVVLNDRIEVLATINQRLPGSAIITGGSRGYEKGEVTDLVAILRHGPLPGRPVLTGVSVR